MAKEEKKNQTFVIPTTSMYTDHNDNVKYHELSS